jgi:hypothetical protein
MARTVFRISIDFILHVVAMDLTFRVRVSPTFFLAGRVECVSRENSARAILRSVPIITASPARKASGAPQAHAEQSPDGPQAAGSPALYFLVRVDWWHEGRNRLHRSRIRYWEPAEWLSALVAVPAAQPVAADWVAPVSAASAGVLFARAAAAFLVPPVLVPVSAPVVFARAAAAFPVPSVLVAASAPLLFAPTAAAFPAPLVLAPALAHGRRPVSGQ